MELDKENAINVVQTRCLIAFNRIVYHVQLVRPLPLDLTSKQEDKSYIVPVVVDPSKIKLEPVNNVQIICAHLISEVLIDVWSQPVVLILLSWEVANAKDVQMDKDQTPNRESAKDKDKWLLLHALNGLGANLVVTVQVILVSKVSNWFSSVMAKVLVSNVHLVDLQHLIIEDAKLQHVHLARWDREMVFVKIQLAQLARLDRMVIVRLVDLVSNQMPQVLTVRQSDVQLTLEDK